MYNRQPKACRGFTLVELIVTIGLLAFLALSAGTLIDAQNWLAHHRLRAAANNMASGMQNARMEAVKRNTYCSITFFQHLDGTTYDFIMYQDSNRNLQFDGETDTVMKKLLLSADYKGVSLVGITFVKNDLDLPSLAFDPRGFCRNRTGGFGAGTATFSDTNGNRLSVVVNQAGRIRTE
jgi:type IV fimbrial biogenesis protein FimT